MRLVPAFLFLAAQVLVLAGGVSVAQDSLPPGPGHDETVKACGGCHDIGTFSSIRRSQGEWETTITNMINFGATISDDDFDTVLAYLTTYLGTGPPPAPPP